MLSISMCRDSQQTIVYLICCIHQTWRGSCHLFEPAVKASKHATTKNDVGAKSIINGGMCDVLKSSPEVLLFAKNVLQESALRMLAHHLTLRGCGIVPCFSGRYVARGNCQKRH